MTMTKPYPCVEITPVHAIRHLPLHGITESELASIMNEHFTAVDDYNDARTLLDAKLIEVGFRSVTPASVYWAVKFGGFEK